MPNFQYAGNAIHFRAGKKSGGFFSMEKNEIIINAEETSLGRVATYAAKQALLKKKVIVVNCEKALISGNKEAAVARYKAKIAIGKGKSNQGPFFPKSPERIMKRTVRGMLPWAITRGKEALKNVICYDAVPSEFKDKEMISFEKPLMKSIMLKELCRLL